MHQSGEKSKGSITICKCAAVQHRQEATYLCKDSLTGLDAAAELLHRQPSAQI